MPVESARKVARQARWLAAVSAHPDIATLRTDAHRNLVKVAWAHACWMDWDTGTSRPTLERLVEQTGVSERTVQRCRSWLRDRGLLQLLELGSTPRYRGRLQRALLGPVGNRASLYRHAMPGAAPETAAELAVDETVTPSVRPCVARSENVRARPEITTARWGRNCPLL